MKRGTPEHPKFKRLCKALNLYKYEAAGVLESLWHFTAQFAPHGDIGKFTDEEIAAAIGWTRRSGKAGVTSGSCLVHGLVTSGWLDGPYEVPSRSPQGHSEVPGRCLLVHDWKDHCDESVRKWMSRHCLDFVSLPLPLPLPLPEPEPLPTARPLLREVPRGLPNPGCQDFEVRFERLYVSHPKTGFEFEGKARYIEIITSAVMPDATADSIDKTHGIWLEFWRSNPAEFVPTLSKWFEDKYYLKQPVERAAPRPMRQQLRPGYSPCPACGCNPCAPNCRAALAVAK